MDIPRDDIRAISTMDGEAAWTNLRRGKAEISIDEVTVGWADEDVVKKLPREFSSSYEVLCITRY